MIHRDDILCEFEKDLDDLLADAPEDVSDSARNAFKEEFVGYTKRVLDALTTRELQSAGAYNRFIHNTLAQVRMRMHEQRR